MVDPLSVRHTACRAFRAHRPAECLEKPALMGTGTPSGCRSPDACGGPFRFTCAPRLYGGGRTRACGQAARAFRHGRISGCGGWCLCRRASAVSGWPALAGDTRPRRFLAHGLRFCPRRDAGAVPQASMAGRPAHGDGDPPYAKTGRAVTVAQVVCDKARCAIVMPSSRP